MELGSDADLTDLAGTGVPLPVFASMPDPWDHPRTITGASVMCNWAVRHGGSLEVLLNGTGIAERELNDPDHMIEAQQEIVLIRNLLSSSGGKAGIGALIGREYHLTAYGYYGFLMLACSTVSDLVRLALRYSPLTFVFSTMRGEFLSGDRWALIAETNGVPDDITDFVIERDLSGALMIQRELFSSLPDVPLKEVRFARELDSEQARATYWEVFRVPVSFGRERNELVFDREYLDMAMPMANEHTETMLRNQCDQLREQRMRVKGIAGTVRQYLLERETLDCTLEDCAVDMHYSPRTLRRALTREGTSYRQIRDDVRRSVAHDLFRDNRLRKSDLVERLGYGDWSSLSRAMRRWQTP